MPERPSFRPSEEEAPTIHESLRDPEKLPEGLIEIEKVYDLRRQYKDQVALFERVGILKDGCITGIDGKEYPVPTLEGIAARIEKKRDVLDGKHDQGLDQLLLVPIGMSLDVLMDTFKKFLLIYKQVHPDFGLDADRPLYTWETGYQGADRGEHPKLVYDIVSFGEEHGGKSKMKLLEDQGQNPDSTPGWRVMLVQKASQISVMNRTPEEHLSTLQAAKNNPDSPDYGESGMTPEGWMIDFMANLEETGRPLDVAACLVGSYFVDSHYIPMARWNKDSQLVLLDAIDPQSKDQDVGGYFATEV